jgi:NAD+ diphosphatase
MPPAPPSAAYRRARSEANFYADCGLDRVSEKRKDAAWLAERLADPLSRFVPVWRSRNWVDPKEARAILLEGDRLAALPPGELEPVLLGLAGEVAYFAVDVSHLEGGENGPALAEAVSATFLDLRLVGPRLARAEGGMLAYARGMLTWHRRHRFCGQCGAPTRSIEGGHVRVCTAEACKLEQFPRTDPAVIMLVTHGERCLLGSNPRFPPGMYSTLAGFVEPGETLESAVAREVFEEAGVRVGNVRYHSSQPWPFPTSLMLGFYAEAESDALAVNATELRDARWFTRDWIRANAREFHETDAPFRVPRADSIARRLIDDWLKGEA